MATDPIVPFSSPAEAYEVDIASAAAEIRKQDHGPTGRLTKVLINLPGLRVVLVSIKSGGSWKEHSTPGRITVQPLSGHLRMHFSGGEFDLRPGNLAAFAASVPHDVSADQDSVFVLTVARPKLD